MAVKKYKVANPRGVPDTENIHIIGWNERVDKWTRIQHFAYAGETFVKPDYLRDDEIAPWIERGFLVEAQEDG